MYKMDDIVAVSTNLLSVFGRILAIIIVRCHTVLPYLQSSD